MFDLKEYNKNKETKKQIKNLGKDWQNWYTKNHSNVEIGCTFTPEKCPDQNLSLESFEYCLRVLNIKQLRFPLRWNSIQKDDGSLDLSAYLPYFEVMEKFDDLQICLNLGPIKTTDWPEIHIPQFVLKDLPKVPTWPFELPLDHKLVDTSSQYLDNLCALLTQKLSAKVIDSITIIQLNNEAFNPFGEPRIVLSPMSELHFAKICSKYFKNKQYLFNSAGRLQVNKILKTLNLFERNGFGKNILGIDYYYHTPTNLRFPNLDPLSVSMAHNFGMQKLVNKLSKQNFDLEFSELQMEKWGEITHPADSLESLKYALTRSTQYLPTHQKKLTVRLWGVEILACKILSNQLEGEEVEMVKVISEVNKKSETNIM